MAHNPIINAQSKQYFVPLDKLHQWLIEQLKSSEYPLPISEVLTKYHEFIVEEGLESDKSATLCRVRLRNRLEKFYPNEFAFVVPNKRDGTYIALNDLNHYVCSAIKKAHDDKDKATKVIPLSYSILLHSILMSRRPWSLPSSLHPHRMITNVKHAKLL